MIGGLSHCHAPADGLQHLNIVIVVANRHDLFWWNSQLLCQSNDSAGFGASGMHNSQFGRVIAAAPGHIPGTIQL